MTTEDLVNWLKSSTELGMLDREILTAIATELEVKTFPPNYRLTIEDTPLTHLYILIFPLKYMAITVCAKGHYYNLSCSFQLKV